MERRKKNRLLQHNFALDELEILANQKKLNAFLWHNSYSGIHLNAFIKCKNKL